MPLRQRTERELCPGSRLAYWSAGGDPAFQKALERARLAVEVHHVRAHPTVKSWHTIFVATRAEARGAGERGLILKSDKLSSFHPTTWPYAETQRR